VERDRWSAEHLDDNTREWLAEDARWFLHQALSTPCLNVLARCQGSYIEDLQGRRYLDFHGNNVHHVGFANPRVIEAITRQMRELSALGAIRTFRRSDCEETGRNCAGPPQ
jgi:4-aminobutyrate aminotransferase